MRKKVKRALALVLAAAFIVTSVNDKQLFVSAETTESSEDVSAVAEGATGTLDVEDPALGVEDHVTEEVQTIPEEESTEEVLMEEIPAEPAPGVEDHVTEEVQTIPEEESTEEVLTEEIPAEPASEGESGEIPAAAEEDPVTGGEVKEESKISVAEETPMAGSEVPATEEISDVAVTEKPEEKAAAPFVPEERPDGVKVEAYAAAGVLPDDAVLKVVELDVDDKAYAEAEQALAENGVSYDGVLMLDIGFWKDGAEIEPEDGKVQVKMELDASLLPEDADITTLAVHHVKEKDEGTAVETLADMTDATEGIMKVDAEEEVVAVEFETESFSPVPVTFATKNAEVKPLADEMTYELTLRKEWKTKGGLEVTNIPFSKVEVDVQQYKWVTDPNTLETKPVPIGLPVTLTLTKDTEWSASYSEGIEAYSYFEALGERVFCENGAGGEAEITEEELENWGWDLGGFEANRDYTGALGNLEVIHPKNNDTYVIDGNGVFAYSDQGELYVWIPYYEKITDSLDQIAEELVNSKSENKMNFVTKQNIHFLSDNDLKNKGVGIVYQSNGKVALTFNLQSMWSNVWTGPISFASSDIASILTNLLDTSIAQEIPVKKIWVDNNNATNIRPTTIKILLMKKVDGKEEQVKSAEISGEGDIWTYTFEDILKYNSDGSLIQYYIKEDKIPEGYTSRVDDFTITNTLSHVTLTVSKVVAGDMGDQSHEAFKFYLSLIKDGTLYKEDIVIEKDGVTNTVNYGSVSFDSSKSGYEFSLVHNESVTIKIPYGYTYEVVEKDYSIEGYTTNIENNKVSAIKNETVTVTNTKNIVPPTGIFRDTAPYLLMLLASFGCIVLLFFRRRRV